MLGVPGSYLNVDMAFLSPAFANGMNTIKSEVSFSYEIVKCKL